MNKCFPATCWLPLALILVAAGCATPQGEFGNRTAVLIKSHAPKEILEMTIKVFEEKGYELRTSDRTTAMFERKGSHWQTAKWGGWSGAVWERATVKVGEHGAGGQLLEVDVVLIGDKGDEFFEDKKALPRREYKPFQEMLNEVQARLQGPSA